MSDYTFLTLDDVYAEHAEQLELYGGAAGVIDQGVIESAAAQASATMFGQYLHNDIAEIAAAYLFYLAASQGFCDGNKRTGAALADLFLEMNGYELKCDPEELYEITMQVANKVTDKEGVAEWIRDRLAPIC
jgi:death-on-curing protein